MNYYELLYIVQPTVSEEELKSVMDDIGERIGKAKGEILKNEVWQKRNLAYPIKKFKQGYYILVHYKAESQVPKIIEERLRIVENVLRFMHTNMLDKDIAKYQPKPKNAENTEEQVDGKPE